MTRSSARQLRMGLAVLHPLEAVVMLWIALPQAFKVAAQFESGYVPNWYPLFVVLVAAPLLLAVLTLALLVLWLRRGMRWPLVATDAVVACLSWSAFLIYLFGSDLALALLILAPACLLLAVVTARMERRGSV